MQNQQVLITRGRIFDVSRTFRDDAKLGIVQGVAYPNQNRSHFRSTDIWTSGSPADEFWTTGWIGRHFDELYEGYRKIYGDFDARKIVEDIFELSLVD